MIRWNRCPNRHHVASLEHTARHTEQQPTLSRSVSGGWRLEIPVVAAVLALAAFLRLYDLTSFPSGLHGDEAITGLEAQRILAEGWIGVYSPLALGQPTGPLYLTAIAVWLLGDTILAVRIVPALLSVVTVLVLYVLVRQRLGLPVATISALLFAIMGWHVHYGRIGFPLSAWPLAALLAVWALERAIRTGQSRWWAVAGAMTGAGVYVYHAHTLLLGILGLLALRHLFGWAAASVAVGVGAALLFPHPVTLLGLGASGIWLALRHDGITRTSFARFAAFCVSLGVVVLPMLRFAANPANGYFDHAQGVSLFEQEEWTDRRGAGAQGVFLLERYGGYWARLCCRPEVDGVDATGSVPIVPVVMLALAAVGVPFWRRSRTFLSLGLVILLAMPWASVFTVGGLARRTFIIAPFLAVFAAVGIVSVLGLVRRKRAIVRYAAWMAVLGLMVTSMVQNIANQFDGVRGGSEEHWIFAHDITETARYLRTLPDDRHVYFFADRWSVDYETRQFLAPDVSAEDRSTEYGELTLQVDAERGSPVFVFLGRYRYLADRIEVFYPHGEMTVGPAIDGTEPSFIAYVPEGEGPFPVLHIQDDISGIFGPSP